MDGSTYTKDIVEALADGAVTSSVHNPAISSIVEDVVVLEAVAPSAVG